MGVDDPRVRRAICAPAASLRDAQADVLIEIETQGVADRGRQGERVPIAVVVDPDAGRRAALHRLAPFFGAPAGLDAGAGLRALFGAAASGRADSIFISTA